MAVQMYGHVTGTVNRPPSVNLGQQSSNKNGRAQRRPLYGRRHCTGMYLHILPLYTHLSCACLIAPLQPPTIAATSGTCMHMPPSATARGSPLTFQALLLALRHNPYPTTAPLILDYSGSDPLGGWGRHPIRISLSWTICHPSLIFPVHTIDLDELFP